MDLFNASILFETPPSDLFRHLQVGQTECRKRRIWVGLGVGVCIGVRVRVGVCIGVCVGICICVGLGVGVCIVTGKQIGRAHV